MIADDRLLRIVRAVVRAVMPDPRFYAVHEYTVVSGDGASGFMLVSSEDDMPDLPPVQLWQASNAATVFTPGARVLVGFRNGDRTKPYIAADGAVIRFGETIVFPGPGPAPIVRTPPP